MFISLVILTKTLLTLIIKSSKEDPEKLNKISEYCKNLEGYEEIFPDSNIDIDMNLDEVMKQIDSNLDKDINLINNEKLKTLYLN